MIEPISQTIFSGIAIGLLCGIIYGISKKLYLIIWGISAFLIILSYFILGSSEITTSLNWGIWNWITMLITVNIGMFIGITAVKAIKEEFK